MKPTYLLLGLAGAAVAFLLVRKSDKVTQASLPVSRVQGSIRPASSAGNVSSGLASSIGQVGGSLLSTWAASRNTGTSPPPSLANLKGLF